MRENPSKQDSDVPPRWVRSTTTVVGAVLLAIVLFALAGAFLPRWWASLVTGWVQGVPSAGILAGIVIGVLFTIIPVAIGVVAWRWRKPWRVRLIIGGVALLFTLPLVLTLTIDVSTTLAALEARDVLVEQAPSFTGAVYVSALLTTVVSIVAIVLIRRWIAAREDVRKLRGSLAKGQSRERDRAARDAAAEEARIAAARDAAARERAASGIDPDSSSGESSQV